MRYFLKDRLKALPNPFGLPSTQGRMRSIRRKYAFQRLHEVGQPGSSLRRTSQLQTVFSLRKIAVLSRGKPQRD